VKITRQLFMGDGDRSLAAVGHLFTQIHRAIELLNELQQPPRATDPVEAHKEFMAREEDIVFELEAIAKEIFVALTNKKVVKTRSAV
jgi:hypothetical protein